MENMKPNMPSAIVLMLGIIILSFGASILSMSESRGIALFSGIIVCLFSSIMVLGGLYRLISGDKEDELMRQEKEKKKQKALESEAKLIESYESSIKEYDLLYGILSAKFLISTYGSSNYTDKYIFIYEASSHIIIRDIVYKFSDIITCELTNNSQTIYSSVESHTRTNTASTLGRAVVGGVLLGGAGAIIGGATANKRTIVNKQLAKTTNNYSIHLTVNKITDPYLSIKIGENENLARNLYSLFSVITERSKYKE